MTIAILIVAALAAGFAAAAWYEVHSSRVPKGLAGRAVLVSTTGSTSVRGVVHADLPDRMTIRNAVVQTVGTDAEAPAAGLLHIERDRIDYVQELPAPKTEG